MISLRVGLLSQTHEIGMSRAAIRDCLRANGCSHLRILKNHLHFWILPIWLAARKTRPTSG